jgi:hypothetical protein
MDIGRVSRCQCTFLHYFEFPSYLNHIDMT